MPLEIETMPRSSVFLTRSFNHETNLFNPSHYMGYRNPHSNLLQTLRNNHET